MLHKNTASQEEEVAIDAIPENLSQDIWRKN